MSGLSWLIRNQFFDWLTGAINLTDNWIVNLVITSILGSILYTITFAKVGELYHADIISGSFAGKVCYLILYIIYLFIAVVLLWLLKVVHSFVILLGLSMMWSWVIAVVLLLAVIIGLLYFIYRGLNYIRNIG